MKYPIIIILFCTISFGCLKDDELNQPYTSYEPKMIDDGLILSNPEDENIDGQSLTNIYKNVYADENLWSLRSLLVFRNGKLVSEAYLKDDEDITNRYIVWSCTKQVMGVLTGISFDKGLLIDINDPISNYFSDGLANYPDKGVITIKNLLNMQSGIDYNNDTETDEILREMPDNSLEFILNLPVYSAQGTDFHYNDGNPHLISALLQDLTGKPTDIFADEELFSKIELTNYNWVRYKDGITLGGFGIETTPRELSKIALCVADSGRWKGNQVVSTNWVKDMLMPKIQIEGFDYSFGYFWWIDEAREIYFMWGVGGQFAFIVPEKELVVLMTSFPNTKGEYEIQPDEALNIVDMIIDASK